MKVRFVAFFIFLFSSLVAQASDTFYGEHQTQKGYSFKLREWLSSDDPAWFDLETREKPTFANFVDGRDESTFLEESEKKREKINQVRKEESIKFPYRTQTAIVSSDNDLIGRLDVNGKGALTVYIASSARGSGLGSAVYQTLLKASKDVPLTAGIDIYNSASLYLHLKQGFKLRSLFTVEARAENVELNILVFLLDYPEVHSILPEDKEQKESEDFYAKYTYTPTPDWMTDDLIQGLASKNVDERILAQEYVFEQMGEKFLSTEDMTAWYTAQREYQEKIDAMLIDAMFKVREKMKSFTNRVFEIYRKN
jgi:hypothetical protein